jgi:hypothetical protein
MATITANLLPETSYVHITPYASSWRQFAAGVSRQ